MTTNTTLSEIAATSLDAVRTLERYGLDYCCGGKQAFDEACLTKGLNPAAVMDEIERRRDTGDAGRDWQTAPLTDLVRHIVAVHHEYLRLELPALAARLAKVHSVHGPKDQAMWDRMLQVYTGLREELEMHLQKEEQILFPFIERYVAAASRNHPMPAVPFGTIARPIAMMEMEHTGAGDALSELRILTGGYELPPYACTTLRLLYDGLQALESDLHLHIHLENNILFRRAIAMESH